MLAEGQVQIVSDYRDLVMGEGTLYDLQDEFNPYARSVRAEQSGPRAWAHGSYSGAEWQNEAVIPIRVIANGANQDVPTTRAAIQAWSAVFHGTGDTGEVAELRYRLDGDSEEYVMFGTPRGSEPDLSTMGAGYVYASGAFVAQDPRHYAGTLTEVSTGLPLQRGGLTVPFTVPFNVTGRLVGGRLTLTNAGTAATGMTVRIDGPAPEPGFVLRGADGLPQSVRFDLDLLTGQWLDVDVTKRLALLNGLPGSNQRGRATWLMDKYPLQPGVTDFRFVAGDYDPAALATVSFRSAWW